MTTQSEIAKLVAYLCANPDANMTVWCGQIMAPYAKGCVAEFHSHLAATTALRAAREEIAKRVQSKGDRIETYMAIHHPDCI